MDISYDEVTLEINNELAVALYPVLSKQAAETSAKYQCLFRQYADEEYQAFEKYLKSL